VGGVIELRTESGESDDSQVSERARISMESTESSEVEEEGGFVIKSMRLAGLSICGETDVTERALG
jgi:hypothetical protein